MEIHVLRALEALKRASEDVESNPRGRAEDGDSSSPSMKALLELETGSADLFSDDPSLSTLSHLLSHLRTLAECLRSKTRGLRGFLQRRSSGQEISRVAGSIGSELQSWIDRESADRLASALRSPATDADEKAALLAALEARVARGFDRALQDALLRAGAYSAVESALADPSAEQPVRERAAGAVLALVRFSKAVFVGPVLMGPAVGALVAMGTAVAVRALCGLIASIRSPLIDELHASGEIPRIIALLSSGDAEIGASALDCVLEIGYYGRKEAIDALLVGGVIKRLVALQRSELGGAMIEKDGGDGRPFASCVARFAIQLEVGEGLRQRERRAVKLEVVQRVREAVTSDAEAGTVLAEVLWGSTDW